MRLTSTHEVSRKAQFTLPMEYISHRTLVQVCTEYCGRLTAEWSRAQPLGEGQLPIQVSRSLHGVLGPHGPPPGSRWFSALSRSSCALGAGR